MSYFNVVEEGDFWIIYDENGDFIESFSSEQEAKFRCQDLNDEFEDKGDFLYEQAKDYCGEE